MPVNGVISSDDLVKISELLAENGYSSTDITVVINVRSNEILKRINDDFYYRNNDGGTPPDVDEINVNVGGINFKYVVEEGRQ